MLSCTKGGAARAAVGVGGYGSSLAVAPKTYLGHTGLVRSLEPHPYNNKYGHMILRVGGLCGDVTPKVHVARLHRYFLSAGDWTSRLWNIAAAAPVLTPGPSPSMITAARWSSTRAAVWFSSRLDGTVEAWDLLASPYDCIYHTRVRIATLVRVCGMLTHEPRAPLPAAGERKPTPVPAGPQARSHAGFWRLERRRDTARGRRHPGRAKTSGTRACHQFFLQH